MAKEFRGTIGLDVRDSVSDWDAFLPDRAPKGAPREHVLPSGAAWALCGAVVVVAGWAVHYWIGPARASRHWDQYMSLAIAGKKHLPESLRSGRSAELGEIDVLRPEVIAAMTAALERTVQADPHHALPKEIGRRHKAGPPERPQGEGEGGEKAEQCGDRQRAGVDPEADVDRQQALDQAEHGRRQQGTHEQAEPDTDAGDHQDL